MKFIIEPSRDGKCFVKQLANNSETLNTSETYERWAGAIKNIRAVISGHNPAVNSHFKVVDLVKNQTFEFVVEPDNNKAFFIRQHNTKPLTPAQLKKYVRIN